MQLVEHFISIQGEGKYSGIPSIFLRFGGCNLKCPKFGVSDSDGNIGCDTTRAVYKNSSWENTDYSTLVKTLNSYTKTPHIVITGGEPLLNYKNKDFINLLEYMVQNDFEITIETNATIQIDFEKYPIYKNIVFSMSVKLSNSGESEAKRINISAIKSIINSSKECFLKFVCSDVAQDEKEIQSLISKLPKTTVYCMPMGTNSKELNSQASKIIDMCIKNTFYYTDRLQVRIWENEHAK